MFSDPGHPGNADSAKHTRWRNHDMRRGRLVHLALLIGAMTTAVWLLAAVLAFFAA